MEGKLKNHNIDLVVVRINKLGNICNARPCYNCLNMMKAAGIRKVYYSISSTNLVCENVKNMISIQSSSSTKKIEIYKGLCIDSDPIKYYDRLLRKVFPDRIKKINLDNFIQYNLINVLPSYTVKIHVICNQQYVLIIDNNNCVVIRSLILL